MRQTPESVRKDVNAIFERLLAQEREVTLLSLAIEILAAQSSAFVVFAKLGEGPTGTARAFMITGDDIREPTLVEAVKKWVVDP